MAADDLFLDVGDVLQLQFLPDDSNTRHYVKVIGFLPEKSLIVTTPNNNGKIMLIREGQPLAVRLLAGNNVMAFTVSVLRSCARPYPYLHLSYPNDLQTIMVRKAQRIGYKTKAMVKDCGPGAAGKSSQESDVDVEDMSTTGALLISDDKLGDVKGLLSVKLKLTIAQDDEQLVLIAIIRNVRKRNKEGGDQKEYLHGVEFQFADRQESIMLHAFIYEQIANSHA